MISHPIPILWFMAGLVLGLIHASSLWRSARSPVHWTAVVGIVRLFVIAAGLTAAAVCGGILATALGWFVAFFAGLVVAVSRFERNTRFEKRGTSS